MDFVKSSMDFVKSHKKEILFVFLIFLLAFGIRGHLMIYELMFGFDSYFHARIAEDVAQTLDVSQYEKLGYYHLGEGTPALKVTSMFFWYFTAIIFNIFTLFGPLTREAWIFAVKLFPALFGALISVAMYFLGREAYSKKAGVAMALFAAVVPSFVYRTMAGFFEEDALGFLWFVVGLIFFVRAIKKAEFNSETIKNAIIASFFFILMALTWELFLLVPIVLVGWLVLTLILLWFRKESNSNIINLTKTFAIVFIIFAVFATLGTGPQWIDSTTSYVTRYLPISGENIDRISGGEEGVIGASVGEEQLGFNFWGNKYSALIVFPVLALLVFIPYRLLRKKNDYVTLLFFTWILVTMFMAYIKLKFTFVFGLPVAAAAGIIIHELFNWTGMKKGFEAKSIALVIGFMMLVGIAAGAFFVSQNVPNIEHGDGWKETLFWINENTPEDSKFFNWWDQGHWMTFVAQRQVASDNRNASSKTNTDVATFILTPDENKARGIIREYNPDYVILGDDMIGKMNSLGIYAYNTTDLNDERLKQYFSIAMPCRKIRDSVSQRVNVQCGNNNLSLEQYNALPTKRIEEPNQTVQSQFRAFVYRNEAGTKLFMLNKAANDTMIVKLFFDTENVDGFEEIYTNKSVKIFKPTFLAE